MKKDFPRFLAIDTSTDAFSIAILSKDKIIKFHKLAPKMHAKILLFEIENLLSKAKIKLFEFNSFILGIGPGSFTGLRVSCSIIQAWSWITKKPVIQVSTLKTLAQGIYRNLGLKKILVYLPASRKEVYWGFFEIDSNGIMQNQSKENISPPDFLIQNFPLWKPMTGYPKAEDMITIAKIEYKMKNFYFSHQISPIYIQK